MALRRGGFSVALCFNLCGFWFCFALLSLFLMRPFISLLHLSVFDVPLWLWIREAMQLWDGFRFLFIAFLVLVAYW